MIDLHTHTNISDGTDNPIDLLKKAEENKIELISITDHDSIGAYEILANYNINEIYSGKIVKGIEIKTSFDGIPIEILGYGINIDKFKDSKCNDTDKVNSNQIKYLENYKRIGKELGLIFDENIKILPKEYAAVNFYNAIINNKINEKVFPGLSEIKREDFYRLTSGNINSPFYINENEDSLDINFVIDEIHRCGGKAFLAHLYKYKVDSHKKFLEEIISKTNIDGVECYYSSFNKTQIEEIISITKKNNLYLSGGTDYHGLNKPSIKLGIGYGNNDVPYSEIKKWLKEEYFYN